MKLFDSEFYLQLVNSLNKLSEIDFEENSHHTVTSPTFTVVSDTLTTQEPKKKLYNSLEFKKFLNDYMDRKYKQKRETLSDEFSERIYRQMYEKGLRENPDANMFTKVMYNPDITKSDFKYLREKRANFPKYVFYNEIGCFISILAIYYKTPIGSWIKKNMLLGGIGIGLAPLVTLFATQKLNAVLLNRKVRKLNLHTKYGIK